MIKVMQILTDTNIGGAGVWLLNFLSGYDRQKLDVTVVLPESSKLEARVAELGVRCITAENIADVSFSLDAVKTLKALFSEENPDIIHTHACLSARVAAKLSGISVVNTRHCIEPRKHGVKRIFYRMINSYLSDSSIAVSNAVRNNLLEDGIPENRIDVIYNGVPPLTEYTPEKRLAVRERLGLKGSLTVGIFARLEPVKNHRIFLQAAAAAHDLFPDFRFLIVGDGALSAELKKEAADLGISDVVTFTGYVSDITELMNATDINVLTSDREAMSISLVEGMTLAKPCITTDAGGPREVVANGVSGFIVPCGDSVGLTAALLKLAAEPELRRSFGLAGQNIAREKFSPEEMFKRLSDVYERF